MSNETGGCNTSGAAKGSGKSLASFNESSFTDGHQKPPGADRMADLVIAPFGQEPANVPVSFRSDEVLRGMSTEFVNSLLGRAPAKGAPLTAGPGRTPSNNYQAATPPANTLPWTNRTARVTPMATALRATISSPLTGLLRPRRATHLQIAMQPGAGMVIRQTNGENALDHGLLGAGSEGCCCITDIKLELDNQPTGNQERYGIGFTITVETTWKPSAKGRDCQILWLEKHMWSRDPDQKNWDWVGRYESQFPKHADKDAPRAWAARKKAGNEVTRLRDLPSLVTGAARDHEIHFIILLASGCEGDEECKSQMFVLRQRTTLGADGQGDDNRTWIEDVTGTEQGKAMVKAWTQEGLQRMAEVVRPG